MDIFLIIVSVVGDIVVGVVVTVVVVVVIKVITRTDYDTLNNSVNYTSEIVYGTVHR